MRLKTGILFCTLLLISGLFQPGMGLDTDQKALTPRFVKEIDMSSGPLARGLDTMVRLFIPSDHGARGFLRDVRSVKLAVYEMDDRWRDEASVRRIIDRLEDDGWERAVKVREKDEEVWILYRGDDRGIRDVYIVAVNPERLIEVRDDPRADRMIARVMERTEDDPFWDRRPHRLKRRWYSRRYMPWENKTSSAYEPWWEHDQIHVRYNRVDGGYAGFRLSGDYHAQYGLTPFGEIGYAFNDERVQYQAGGELFGFPGRSHLISLGFELHDQTDTQDDWIAPELENSLAGVLFREDFRDYYRRKGFGMFGVYKFNGIVQLSGRYLQDDFSSLSNRVNWNLIDHRYVRASFRPNPLIDEGKINSVQASLRVDTRNSRRNVWQGWYIDAMVERAGGALGGDYAFERYLGDIRRYQPAGRGARLDLRARLGAAEGALPGQYLFDLGGFSTIRGYGFKAFTGDRMMLFNAEYWIENKRMWGDHWPMNMFRVGAFLDAGAAWFAHPPAAGPGVGINGSILMKQDIRSSAGIGVNVESLRVYFARPLNDANDNWEISLRIRRSF